MTRKNALSSISIAHYISAIGFIFAALSLGYGLFDYYSESPQPSFGVKQTVSLIILPVVGVLVGLYSPLLQLLINAEHLEKDLRELTDTTDRFGQSLQLSDVVVRISDKLSTCRFSDYPVVRHQVEHLIDRFRRSLQELENGHFFEYEPDNFYTFAITMFEFAKDEIQATSLVNPEFWLSADGRAYLERNRKLIENGKKITRYFLFEIAPVEDREKLFKDIIGQQIAAGVSVWVVNFENQMKSFCETAMHDIGLIDNEIAIFDTYDGKKGEMLKCDCWHSVPNKIQQAQNIFMALRGAAVEGKHFLSAG